MTPVLLWEGLRDGAPSDIILKKEEIKMLNSHIPQCIKVGKGIRGGGGGEEKAFLSPPKKPLCLKCTHDRKMSKKYIYSNCTVRISAHSKSSWKLLKILPGIGGSRFLFPPGWYKRVGDWRSRQTGRGDGEVVVVGTGGASSRYSLPSPPPPPPLQFSSSLSSGLMAGLVRL